MKVRVEFGNGNPSQIRVFDAETGVRRGRVISVEMRAYYTGAALMQYAHSNDDNVVTVSPWLVGRLNENDEFIFQQEWEQTAEVE